MPEWYDYAPTRERDDDVIERYRKKAGSVEDYLSGVMGQRQAGQERLAKMQAERVKSFEDAQKQAEFEQQTNMASHIGKGAQIGSAGGPWGALAGAIVGTGAGAISGWDARRKAGKSRWGAFKGLAKDLMDPREMLKESKAAYAQDPQMGAQLASMGAREVRGRMPAKRVEATPASLDMSPREVQLGQRQDPINYGQLMEDEEMFRLGGDVPDYELESTSPLGAGQRPVRKRGLFQ